MAKPNKTTETEKSVGEFIDDFVQSEQKKKDTFLLIESMRQWSGYEPVMWGPSIIGFGRYHYRYASGREGDMPLLGFSPRKAAFSLYVTIPGREDPQLLQKLGRYTMGKSCIYFKKLEDINLKILQAICEATIAYHAAESSRVSRD